MRNISTLADCKCVDRPTPPPAPPALQPVQTSFSCAANEWRGMDTGGRADWSCGKITFSINGLAFDMLPGGKDYFLFMPKLKAPNGQESVFPPYPGLGGTTTVIEPKLG